MCFQPIFSEIHYKQEIYCEEFPFNALPELSSAQNELQNNVYVYINKLRTKKWLKIENRAICV